MSFHQMTYSGRRVHRALEKLGCTRVNHKKHAKYVTQSGRILSVPGHKDVSARCLRHAVELAGMDWDSLMRHY